MGVKPPGHKADHSPPSSAKVKEWVKLHLHSPVCLHGMVLSYEKHRNSFTFSVYLIMLCHL